MPSSEKHPSRVPMWKGVKLAYLLIAICLFPLSIGGYWAYGQMVLYFPFVNDLNCKILVHKIVLNFINRYQKMGAC
jgi:nitrate reductase NapE component